MGEFPEDICRLVNEFVPWDRHHRSPTAQLVRTEEFQHYQLLATESWQDRYIFMAVSIMGRAELYVDITITWEDIQQMTNIDTESKALERMESSCMRFGITDHENESD